MPPLVSVCIPTYRRPAGLARALQSILTADEESLAQVQVVVSDNSPDEHARAVFEDALRTHPGPRLYHRNVPQVGMIGNHNRCIELAEGRHVLILHDDDHLLAGGMQAIVDSCRDHDDPVKVFGVHVVDDRGHRIAEQVHRRRVHLEPAEAVRRLLTDSSYVRFPSVVVRRDVYRDLGGFEDGLGGVEDLDTWVRLATEHGLTLIPRTSCAYMVHRDADTETMFNRETLQHIDEVFRRVRSAEVLDEADLLRCQRNFLHQFVLGGTWRALRRGQRSLARERLDLLTSPEFGEHRIAWRWVPARLAMRTMTLSARAPR